MPPNDNPRRLIEDWLPVNEISIEAVREGGALAGHPPVNQLHVWWYACHRNRSHPRKVLAALELMYA